MATLLSEGNQSLPVTGRCSQWLGANGVGTFWERASRRTEAQGGAPHNGGSGWLDGERRRGEEQHVGEMGMEQGSKYLCHGKMAGAAALDFKTR
jgi:hypothetical protein